MTDQTEVRPLKYESLNGLSAQQLTQHHDVLYAGYVKKLAEIRELLKGADRSLSNPNYSEYGELKREEGFAANAKRLHEIYFDVLGGNGTADGEALKMIDKDFGSLDAWKSDMIAAGICARGWVVTAFDLEDGRLHNYCLDTHTIGPGINAIALVVLDVYEHAYFIDYMTARKSYIEAFLANIDFGVVNETIARYGLQDMRNDT